MTTFEAGKTYRTRDGREAFVGYERNGWLFGDIDSIAYRWRASAGRWAGCTDGGPAVADLLPPAPPRIREKRWCNVWPGGRTFEHETADIAQKVADRRCTRIAVPCELVEIVEDAP